MTRLLVALMLATVLALAGCASNPCAGPQTYQKAASKPPLKAVDGLSVPAPDPSTRIPNVAANGASFVSKHKNAQGKMVTTCLATPPSLPSFQKPGENVSSLRQ